MLISVGGQGFAQGHANFSLRQLPFPDFPSGTALYWLRPMLSPKRQRFVDEYLIDLNATQAAIRAGYSPRTSNEQGARLLAYASVRDSIDKALAERSKRNVIDQDRVLQELAIVAFGDITDIVKFENGRMIITETADLTDDQRRMISEMSEKNFKGETSFTVKAYDKLKALELLGKHLGMFIDRKSVSISTEDGKPIPVMVIAEAVGEPTCDD